MTHKHTELVPYSLRDEFLTPFNRLFDTIMHDSFPDFGKSIGINFFETGGRPKVDIIEFDEKVRIRAEISGLAKDDVKVTVKDGYLTLCGEKGKVEEKEGKGYLLHELSHAKFSRTFQLGESLNAKNVKAEFKDGLLTIDIPKVTPTKEQENSYEIKID